MELGAPTAGHRKENSELGLPPLADLETGPLADPETGMLPPADLETALSESELQAKLDESRKARVAKRCMCFWLAVYVLLGVLIFCYDPREHEEKQLSFVDALCLLIITVEPQPCAQLRRIGFDLVCTPAADRLGFDLVHTCSG